MCYTGGNLLKNIFIHPTASVSEECKIGEGTKVWINSQIRENTNIGSNCVISKDTYIDNGVTIGSGCKIQNSVSIYQGVTIGDNVFVGPNACFTNDKIPRAFNTDWKITSTRIEDGVSIGANATIICGITIGKYAMVGSGSVITKDVEPYALVVGNPAKKIAYICKCGERLETSECKVCGEENDIEGLK